MLPRLMTLCACFLTASLMMSCAGSNALPPPPVTDACTWLRVINVDAGYDTRLTRAEKEAILAHNLKVEETCR